MSSLTAHCYSTESNDEFIVQILPSNYQFLICELQKYYPKLNIEITYYDPNFNCNIWIIDDESLNECIESSIYDINVKDIDNSINLQSMRNFVKNNSIGECNLSGMDMSFISGSDSILQSSSVDDGNELEELSTLYNSIELVDNEGNGQVYRVTSKNGPRALKIIPSLSNNDIDSVMKGIFLTKSVESDIGDTATDLTYSLFTRLVKTWNVYLLKNDNICVESEWMDIDMMRFVKSGKIFNPYIFLKYMFTTLHILKKNNIIHRNIKPSIIFPNADGTSFKLSGFEFAKNLEDLKRGPFNLVGKLNFLAPEIVEQMYKGKEKWRKFQSPYTQSSDMFSLGVTVYQLLTFDIQTQWSTRSLELGDEIGSFLKTKITQPCYSNIIPLLAKLLHRKRSERVSLYVARCWINKCIECDPMNCEQDLEISFEDDDLDKYSESSEDIDELVEKFVFDIHDLNLDELNFDD